MPPEEETKEGEAKGNFLYKYRWLLIGVVVVVIIGVVVYFRGGSSSAPKLTLEGVNAQVQTNTLNITAITTNMTALQNNMAMQFENTVSSISNTKTNLQEQIADLPTNGEVDALSGNITTLRTQFNDLVLPPDLTDDVQALNQTISDLETAFDDLQYAVVTDVTSTGATISIHGGGDFSLFVTLYGSGFTGTINANKGSTATFTYGGNTTSVGIISPATLWVDGEIVTVIASAGTVQYVSVSIGK